MEIREVWSVPRERVEAFFLAQDDVRRCGEDLFRFGECEIRLRFLPLRRVGRFSFPQTELVFSGPEEDADAIHKRFVLQFISAGA